LATTEQVKDAASRVLEQLQSECAKVVPHPAADRIQSCEDFRELIPAYRSSSLTPSRRLLFEDHIHECVACRKALESSSLIGGTVEIRHSPDTLAGPRFFRYGLVSLAIAASVVLIFQLSAIRDFIWPADVHAMVQTVDGGLYRVQGQEVRPISAGERVDRSE